MRYSLIGISMLLVGAVVDDDRTVVERAGLPTDPVALLAHLRRLTPQPGDEKTIAAAVSKLSDMAYKTRRQAERDLIDFGPKAVLALNGAVAGGDAEAAHRAQDCLDAIARVHQPATLAAAIRVVAKEQPPGVVDGLLEFLPFADESSADEICTALDRLAREQRLATAIRQHVKSSRPEVRAAAAVALARSRNPQDAQAARALLADSDATVRVRVAEALATAGERPAIPVIIESLDKLRADQLDQADQMLLRLAGDTAPELDYGSNPEELRTYQTAWKQWWDQHGASADLTHLNNTADNGDRFWVSTSRNGKYGSISQGGFDGKFDVKLNTFEYPVAFERVPRGRFLVADYHTNRVVEVDATGRVTRWEKHVTWPCAVQRMPGGKVLVGCRAGIHVFDRDGNDVLFKPFNGLATVARRRDGTMCVLLSTGVCHTLDAAGEVKSTFQVSRPYSFTSIQLLPAGRILLPDYAGNRVVEYDANGRTIWSAEVQRPTGAFRRPDGRLVVVSSLTNQIVELDRQGRMSRHVNLPDGLRSWMVAP